MARKFPLVKGLGILLVSIMFFFAAVFFYAYFTGGELQVLSLFGGNSVGVLQVEGAIESSRETVQNLKQFGENQSIKAVVVRIDSPGGGVAPTQEIYDAIGKLRAKKPVIASLGGVAASGGYYIAAACDQVVANPGTLTGSIGVIMEFGNFEELMRKLGLKGYNIKSGPYKEKTILQSLVDNVYAQFVSAVAKGRKMPEGKVRELADGRVYSGEQAKKLGLIDVLGNMEDAVDLAAKRAGIEGTPEIVYARRQEKSWWEKLVFSYLGRGFNQSERSLLRYEWSPPLIQ